MDQSVGQGIHGVKTSKGHRIKDFDLKKDFQATHVFTGGPIK